MERLSSASNFQFGRSIQSSYHLQRQNRPESQLVGRENYAIKDVETVFSCFPPKKLTAKEKKEAEAKKKLEEEEAKTRIVPPPTQTNEEVLQQAVSWQNAVNIHKKHAVGTLTTSKYDEKTKVFNNVNRAVDEISNIYPMSNYFGPKPNPEKNPFDRRVVK